MAVQGFNPVTGGLVNSVVAGLANTGAQYVTGLVSPSPSSAGAANFSINTLLAETVQNTTGYALAAGENYLLSQLGSVLPPGEFNALGNAVITQVAAAGIQQVSGFLSQGVSSFLGLGGSNVTTAGLGAQASRASKSIPDSVVSELPAADYGGQTYTLDDIVFTLVPANAGPQTAPQSQTPGTVDLNTAFNSKSPIPTPGLDALKGQAAFAGPAVGASPLKGNFSTYNAFTNGSAFSQANAGPTVFSGGIKSSW